uniref:F-box domain-containing protein n=1 Tax=Strongyloides papillosus TaxID=174720 RepID=A0A0N5CGS2_STREA
MNSIGLPVELQLKIFKELSWKDVKNLKFVCKELHSTIVKNIETLDRPNVDYLHIYYTEDKISRVRYALKNNQNIWRIENLKVAVFGDDHEYEDFLKDKDFTEVKFLAFENTMNGEMICLKDSDYNACGVINDIGAFREIRLFVDGYHFCNLDNYYFHIYLSNRTWRPLEVTISSPEKLRMPYSGSVLRKESLRKWGLFERDGSRLIMNKITMDIITSNPLLEYGNTSTDSPAFIQVTNHLYELGLFNLENLCNRKPMQLTFTVYGGLTALDEEFYREFSDKIKFNGNFVVEDNDKMFLIENFGNCLKCHAEHRNTMFCTRSLWTEIFILRLL